MGSLGPRGRTFAPILSVAAFGALIVQQIFVHRSVVRLEDAVARLSARLDESPSRGEPTTARPSIKCVAVADSAEIASQVLSGLERRAPLAAPAPTPQASPEPETKPPPPSDPAAQEAAARGRRLVSDARASGHWGDAQREQLRALEPVLESKVYRELVDQLSAAINSGSLAVDTSGMPF